MSRHAVDGKVHKFPLDLGTFPVEVLWGGFLRWVKIPKPERVIVVDDVEGVGRSVAIQRNGALLGEITSAYQSR